MVRWLTTLAAGYAGAWALVFVLYRAAYGRTRELREWTDVRSQEAIFTLQRLRGELRQVARPDLG
jgi:hypothetical protein